MKRRSLFVCGALAAAVLAGTARTGTSDAATTNIAYDEIVKFAITSTPPPPGNFGADYAAITSPQQTTAEATPPPAPKKRGLFGGFDPRSLAHNLANGEAPGSALGNTAADTAQGAKDASVDNAMDSVLNRQMAPMMSGMGVAFAKLANGTLTRKSFYGNWVRTDDVVGQTAEIEKCDKHQNILLDLGKKTYKIVDTTQGAPSAPSSHASCDRNVPTPAPAQPGTGVLDITSTNTSLSPVSIEGNSAPGERSVNTIAIEKATGSCKNGSYSVSSTTYLSPYAKAHPYCPLPRTYPSTPTEMATAQKNGGCQLRPAMHVSSQQTLPSNRLPYYELMQMGAPNGDASHPISIVTERGNIKTLGAGDAGLFEIPAGFTKAN